MIVMRKSLYFIIFLLFHFFSFSQAGISLTGKIKDTRSNLVEKATIHLLNTNFRASSNANGEFEIENIVAGRYTLQVTSIGFAAYQITLALNNSTNVEIILNDEALYLDAALVTAQKREEGLQALPASISVISAGNVRRFRLWNSKDITAIVPNLYAANPGDNRNVTSIRGITSSSYDPAVATYLDGVNQFGLDTYIAELLDIERIEILRGPQGTLYGRNAMAGVINIITKQPEEITRGFAEINAGNYGLQRYGFGLSAPVVKKKLYFGASGVYNSFNGFYKNAFNQSKFDEQKTMTGNFYLKFLPNHKWVIGLNVKQQQNRNHGAFPLVFGMEEAFKNPYTLNVNATGEMIDNIFNASLSVQHFGRPFNFMSQTAFQSNYRYYKKNIDADFSPLDGISIFNNYGNKWNNVKVFTQEIRFVSPAIDTTLKWIVGAYFFHQNNPVKQAIVFGKDAKLLGTPDSLFSIINTSSAKSSGIAVFGQLNYSIAKNLNAIAGLRYDREQKKQSVLSEYRKDPSGGPQFEIRPDTTATKAFNAISPSIGLIYQPNKATSLFVNYSRGYRTGGLTQLSSDPSQPPLYPYKPEYSNNYEIGVKNNLLNNRLRFNASLFFILVNDAQVPTLVLPEAITVTRNAGKLTSKGFEIELSSALYKSLLMEYNFGYTHATYKKLKISQNGQEKDAAGNYQVFTPDVTSMLAVQQGFKIYKQLKFIARGEWLYIGRKYFDLANSIRQSPYHLLNIRAGLSFDKIEFMFWIRNLTDTRYVDYAYDFGAVHLASPRTFGFTLYGRF